mmetsp:Transcript_17217/g.24364  ORF Transcript_17217/g.24364 Transcript_17217/m.24364 type:complete len:328 (+) Transcript_17217:78-1061(+)
MTENVDLISKMCVNFGIVLKALEMTEFPEEFQPIVKEIWEKVFVFRTFHLKALSEFVRLLRNFLSNYSLDSEDIDLFLDSIEDVESDLESVKSSCVMVQKKYLKLSTEIHQLKRDAEKMKNEAEEREKIATRNIFGFKKEADDAKQEEGKGALATTLGVGIIQVLPIAADIITTGGFFTVLGMIVGTGVVITGAGLELTQCIKKSKNIAKQAKEEIEKENALKVIEAFDSGVLCCIEGLSNLVETFTIEINKCGEHLLQIQSFTSSSRVRGKLFYKKVKNEADLLSKACMDFNAVVPICANLLESCESIVPAQKQDSLRLKWEGDNI